MNATAANGDADDQYQYCIRRGHRGDDDGDSANRMYILSPSQVSSLSFSLPHPRSRFRSLFSLLPLLVSVSFRSYFSWREFNYYIISTH